MQLPGTVRSSPAERGWGSHGCRGAAALTALSPQDWEQRQEEDTLLIERILLLVRNVLHVPPDPTEEQVPYQDGAHLQVPSRSGATVSP